MVSLTKSFHLDENIFKVQITTGINHNKGSLLKQLSSDCFVVVGILRYIGLSANQHEENFNHQVTSQSRIVKWGYPLDVNGLVI